MLDMRQRLLDHSSVVVFPEGTRSADGSLGPFREGAFRLAIDLGVDIVPLADLRDRDGAAQALDGLSAHDGHGRGPAARLRRRPHRRGRRGPGRPRSRRHRPGAASRGEGVVNELDMALVLEARRALAGRIRRTPLEESLPRSPRRPASPVFLKLESLQLTGSFKIRGAFFVMSRLDADARRRGVVTCSAGNHGKAVAYVARELGIPAEIHVPRGVDESKYRGMLALGARVVRSDFDGFDETERVAKAEAERTGRPFLTAFDDAAHPRGQRRNPRGRGPRGRPRPRESSCFPSEARGWPADSPSTRRRRCPRAASSAASTSSPRRSPCRSSAARPS